MVFKKEKTSSDRNGNSDARQLKARRTLREALSPNKELHPLEKHSPNAPKYIKFVRLTYVEEEMTCPIRRRQDLPMNAFGQINVNSVLVATSHAWLCQYHPDPTGEKFLLIKKWFAPRLRRRFKTAEILLFDDWMSCPQRPRTMRDEAIFSSAMKLMNDIYIYCDAVIHVHTELPRVPREIRQAEAVDVQSLEYFAYGNIVQVRNPTDDMGVLTPYDEDRLHHPQRLDIVRRINGIDVKTEDDVRNALEGSDRVTVDFQNRPFGRFNEIHPDNRGWLFLERFTSSVKVAAAGIDRFDDIILTNNHNIRKVRPRRVTRTRTHLLCPSS